MLKSIKSAFIDKISHKNGKFNKKNLILKSIKSLNDKRYLLFKCNNEIEKINIYLNKDLDELNILNEEYNTRRKEALNFTILENNFRHCSSEYYKLENGMYPLRTKIGLLSYHIYQKRKKLKVLKNLQKCYLHSVKKI